MNWGVHPAVGFDRSLAIGQEVEARFKSEGRLIRLRARITKLSRYTAQVESLTDDVNECPAGHVLEIPRFASPEWSPKDGLFPVHS